MGGQSALSLPWIPGPNKTTDPRGEPLLPDQSPFSARLRFIATRGGIIINPPGVFSARHPGCINGNDSSRRDWKCCGHSFRDNNNDSGNRRDSDPSDETGTEWCVSPVGSRVMQQHGLARTSDESVASVCCCHTARMDLRPAADDSVLPQKTSGIGAGVSTAVRIRRSKSSS